MYMYLLTQVVRMIRRYMDIARVGRPATDYRIAVRLWESASHLMSLSHGLTSITCTSV